MSQGLWTQIGETLSHNNACKEYGLEKHEIFDAIKLGKLQYKENYAHGNPYYKLLRQEVIALVIELRGDKFLKARNRVSNKESHKRNKQLQEKNKIKRKEKLMLIQKLEDLKN